jgi:hypothetical protein
MSIMKYTTVAIIAVDVAGVLGGIAGVVMLNPNIQAQEEPVQYVLVQVDLPKTFHIFSGQ